MARGADGRFTKPGGYILNMLLFMLVVGLVVYFLSPYGPQPTTLLLDAFNANPALNGLILFVLFVGVIYNLRQAGSIAPAARWLEAYDRGRKPRWAPNLVAAAKGILENSDDITNDSARAILDSVGTRIDEGREMGRYIGNLLVFLGLLGTFWGLLETVNAVAATISGLATDGAAEDAVAQLIKNLQAPLGGMGVAFSSSLFGLGGSLVVGFLDIQAGQAQNRFYADLEDWLAAQRPSRPSGQRSSFADFVSEGDLAGAVAALEGALSANTETQIKASAGQISELKDEIRALNRTLIRVGGGE
ncbi:MAG: flagellar motor protein MotA [Pseudomonadota bacterium]